MLDYDSIPNKIGEIKSINLISGSDRLHYCFENYLFHSLNSKLETRKTRNCFNLLCANFQLPSDFSPTTVFAFIPKHGSWLNMAEIELNVLNGQCLNRYFSLKSQIVKEVEAWQKHRNNKNSKINWQFTIDDFRVKLRKLYPSIKG